MDICESMENGQEPEAITNKAARSGRRGVLRGKILGVALYAWLIIVVLLLLKLWLVSAIKPNVLEYAAHDDRLFFNLAECIKNGEWLGPYNQLTLIKGFFYPLWIAAVGCLHIPLFLSIHLLYFFATVSILISIKTILIKERYLLTAYILLLFNPISYDAVISSRIVRDHVYMSLTLLAVSFFIGMCLRIQDRPKTIWLWAIGAGLSLSACAFTREEDAWLWPALLLMVAISAVTLAAKKRLDISRAMMIALPFLICLICTLAVSAINYRHYKVFAVTETESIPFVAAYNSLTRVKEKSEIRHVWASKEKRKEIYKVSPSFRQLEEFLEGDLGNGWAASSQQGLPQFDLQGEIAGGWGIWAFRDAVAFAGHYSDGQSAMTFYRKLAREVNDACDRGEVDCHKAPIINTLSPRLRSGDCRQISRGLFKALSLIITHQGIWVEVNPVENTGGDRAYISKKIGTNKFYSAKHASLKISVLKAWINLYSSAIPLLFIFSLAMALRDMSGNKTGHVFQGKRLMVMAACVVLVLTRSLLLSIIDATSFPALQPARLAPLYQFNLIFIVLGIASIGKIKFSR